MKKSRVFAWFFCLMLAVAMLAGCNHADNSDPVQTQEAQQTEGVEHTENGTEANKETEPLETVQESDNSGMVTVSTEFGDLYYQDQWAEYMYTEQASDGSSVLVAFEAEVNGVRYPLFNVAIGSGEGEPVGQITDAAGTKRNVFVSVEELVEASDLTEGEQNRLYAMQEEINYVIENLK